MEPNDQENLIIKTTTPKEIISMDELEAQRKEFQRKDRKLTREEQAFMHAFHLYVNGKLLQSKGRGGPIHIVCWDLIRGPLAVVRDVGVFNGTNNTVIEELQKQYQEEGYKLYIHYSEPYGISLLPRDMSIFRWFCCCFHECIN